MQRLLLLSTLCTLLCAVLSCSCPDEEPADHNKFCDHDYVLQVFVKNSKVVDGVKVYMIAVTEEYKLPAKKVNKGKLVGISADCTPELQTKSLYIVSGMVQGKKLMLDQCSSMVHLANSRNCLQMRKLREETHCECRVKMCNEMSECTPLDGPDVCVNTYLQYSCIERYWVCKKVGNDCKWVQPICLEPIDPLCSTLMPVPIIG